MKEVDLPSSSITTLENVWFNNPRDTVQVLKPYQTRGMRTLSEFELVDTGYTYSTNMRVFSAKMAEVRQRLKKQHPFYSPLIPK